MPLSAASELTPAPPEPAIDLAIGLSIAVRIEPELIRAMRLAVFPYHDVSAEADLWFSEWVRSRGPGGIVLLPEVRAALQDRLAARLRAASSADPIRQIWELVSRLHARTSPALYLEEHVTWLAVSGDSEGIEDALQPALRALAEENRIGVADWFVAAWERLPAAARGTLNAWQLAQIAMQHLPGGRLPISVVPSGIGIADLADVVRFLQDVPLGVRRVDADLELGDLSLEAGTAAIPVPDTDPYILDLLLGAQFGRPAQTIMVRRDDVSRWPVGYGVVRLRTARGLIFEIEPPVTAAQTYGLRSEELTMSDTAPKASEQRDSRPVLFISHRHADQPIADVLRKFVTDRSGGRIAVFQSSSAQAENPRVGRELQKELKEHLWAAGVVVLVYTSPEEDWSYCMWECGVATHPASPEIKIVVLQCGPQPPSVYSDAVRVNALDPTSILKFTNEFLTSPDFFPDRREAVAPGFSPNGDEVQQAGSQLHDALQEVIPSAPEEGDDWATVPFLCLQLTYAEVDAIQKLDASKGARAVLDTARVNQIDGEAKRLFGVGRVDQLELFSRLVEVWEQGRPDAPTGWVDELAEQVRVGSGWRIPRFRWQLLESADDVDRAKYAPILSRVRSVPRQRCHQFDIYFNKFDTDDKGAIRIGFLNEPQAAPGSIPTVAPAGRTGSAGGEVS
jgi:hypothetical protein